MNAINDIRTWLQSLEPRERLMLIIGSTAVVLAVFYYAVWQPINHNLAAARAQVVSEAEQARWMQGLQRQAQALRAQSGDNRIQGRKQSLLAIIDTTSRARGLAEVVSRIQPDSNDKATVILDAAPFNAMLDWLHMLKQDYAIHIAALTITRGKQPGLIQARLQLARDSA